jgi:hypothetical protein
MIDLFLLLFVKKVLLYSCPNCKVDIEQGNKICKNCKTGLIWNKNDKNLKMEYRTMNKKELAKQLNISPDKLRRKMKQLPLEFREHIKGHSLLFENEVQYIHENVEWRAPWEIRMSGQTIFPE